MLLCATGAGLAWAGIAAPQPDAANVDGGVSVPTPRYQNYAPPPGLGESAGEPSIGINPMTGKVFYVANTQTLRLSLDDCASPAVSLWEDVTPPDSAGVTLDPILYTDRSTGRTFTCQLLGKAAETFYSDDDGQTWQRSQGSGINSGVDHQTIGGGPFVPPLTGVGYPNAIYYCSQDAALAQCALSVDGGRTFGPAVPIYTIAQCAGIHGHIKVAPDGTAYVPNKSCGGKQGVAVSENNGATWTVRTLPNSISISGIVDPSVGIGADNTVYFSYRQGGTGPDAGHPRVAVSRDRGVNWINDQDIGGAFGLQNVTFPQATAGDGDRAAVAYIGTPTGGNYQAVLGTANGFKGEWHLYVAHTYDRGVNWIMADATPNDPVQRNAICNGGTVCMNTPNDRNLLDFNDMQTDGEGRALVAYSDGCITERCIQGLDVNNDGYKDNDYSARAVIARQSGGLPLFARFDPPVAGATAPAAPNVTAIRTNTGDAQLSWQAPDNGGSPILGYRVYRRTADGTYPALPLATVNTTSYTDTTGDPLIKYFYKVSAFNAVGESPFCTEFTPLPPVVEDLCFAPGIKVLLDQTGDSLDQTAEHDVQFVGIAEPFAAGAGRLVVTIKVAALTVLTPDTFWPVQFTAPNGMVYFARMRTTAPNTPTFEYGTGTGRDVMNAGTPALPGSGYTPDGTITIVVPASGVGNPQPGQSLTGFLTRIQVGAVTPDNMPNSLAPSGQYVVKGNAYCGPNTPPVAVLNATPVTGAPPLQVTFSGAGSTDAEDAIASYTFRFGDGSPAVTVQSPALPTVSHTYSGVGTYRASLQVTDVRDETSINIAEQFITVSETVPGVVGVVSRKSHGSAGSFDIPLPLQDGLGVECRSGGAGKNYTMIFNFVNNVVSVGSVTKTAGNGMISSTAIGPNPDQFTVSLSNVDTQQVVEITLTNVLDSSGATISNVQAAMGVLIGDSSSDQAVNTGDSQVTRNRSGQLTTGTNFRSDVNTDGTINSGDSAIVRARSGDSITGQ